MSRVCAMARIDVFTDRPFAGNPAAAVLDADGLDEPLMQAIAREMKVAGTAFVSSPTAPGADFRLRKFTPTREVNTSRNARFVPGRNPHSRNWRWTSSLQR